MRPFYWCLIDITFFTYAPATIRLLWVRFIHIKQK